MTASIRSGWWCFLALAGAAGVAVGADVPSAPALVLAPSTPVAAAADRAEDATGGRLLARVAMRGMCFPKDGPAEHQEQLLAQYRARNPVEAMGLRFYPVPTAWQGEADTVGTGTATPAHLTFSFPVDGINWDGRTNELNARLVEKFGHQELGREYIRQSMASWRKYAGLSFTEVGDDNASLNNNSARVATRGDIRIGGGPWGVPNFLAYNYYPSGGADMVINTSYWTAPYLASPFADFRYLRNTIAHEIGHGVGFQHTVPCNDTKCMEPFLSTLFDQLQVDDVRGGQANYGDRFAGNNAAPAAKDFGTLTAPAARSVLERSLSTNGQFGTNNTNEDWFRFTLTTPQNVTITVTPMGGTYNNGLQSSECTGTTSSVVADQAGNLSLELYDQFGFNVLQSSTVQPPGIAETIVRPNTSAGTYTVRVVDEGPNPSPNQRVQLYDLSIRVGNGKATPRAIAGVNKRVQAGTTCHFIGDINSEAQEPGATLDAASYDWDLDGDGVFEVDGDPRPTYSFVSNGSYQTTLRVTDSLGTASTDTIGVTVYGATTTLTAVSPVSGGAGTTVPIVLDGTNFKSVTSASQVTVSGSGATVVGTPVVNTLGTRITGLAVQISAVAVPNVRSITVSTPDGNATLTGGFTITPVVVPANDNCAGAISWGSATGPRPFSNANATNSTVQSFPSSGCPSSGPINNDVWYRWTAPAAGTLTVSCDATLFAPRFAMYNVSTCNPASANLMACDDTRNFAVTVSAGATYLFQVGSATLNQTGAANLVLDILPTTGACCFATGACVQTWAADCTAQGGAYQGDLTSCTPAASNSQAFLGGTSLPLSIPDNTPAGVTSIITVPSAFTVGDVFITLQMTHVNIGDLIITLSNGVKTATLMNRIGIVGATSNGDSSNLSGSYTFLDAGTQTIWSAATGVGDVTITPGSFRPVGMNNTIVRLRNIFGGQPSQGQWTIRLSDNNTTGGGTLTNWTLTLDRSGPSPCPEVEVACCIGTGCSILSPGDCATFGGTSLGLGSTCSPNPCTAPATGACCAAGGSCQIVTAAACSAGGGTYQGDATACSPNPCPQPTGACCTGASCSVLTAAACTGGGGTYQGNGSVCSPSPCSPPTGACCTGSAGTSCIIASAAECAGLGGSFRGEGSACLSPGNPTTCCPANFNSTGGVSVQDIYDFLEAWLGLNPAADINASGAVTVQDIYDYLEAWLAGCPG